MTFATRRITAAQGVTLIELLIAVSILTFIGAAAAALLHTALQTQAYAETRQSLHREAFQIMTRITNGLRAANHTMVPNAHSASRPLLIFSANINNDNDYYGGNTLFPRTDEDYDRDMTMDADPGVSNIDDNGDGLVDGFLLDLLENDRDDDEDGRTDEDKLDGLDNDGDGNIDEDVGDDGNADNRAGIAGIDDDWDGSTDEGDNRDDDEDGSQSEDKIDPLLYTYTSGTKTLTEKNNTTGVTTTLSTKVSAFTAVYEKPDAAGGPRFLITLSLTEAGQTVTLSEYVYPRNILQKTGKRVR